MKKLKVCWVSAGVSSFMAGYLAGDVDELQATEKHEPKLYKAVTNVFADSYAYTRAYHKFRKDLENQSKEYYQMSIEDWLV